MSIVLILVLRGSEKIQAGDIIRIAGNQGLSRWVQIDIENEAILGGCLLHSKREGEEKK